MNPAAALDLRDIHLPPPPGWWPPAPGWWLLGVLLLAIAFLLARLALRRRRLSTQRRVLQRELARLRAEHADADDAAPLLAAISELLRRACKRHDPAALRLQGEAWLTFLDQGFTDSPFSSGPGRLLLDGPFRRSIEPAAVSELVALVERRLTRLPGAQR